MKIHRRTPREDGGLEGLMYKPRNTGVTEAGRGAWPNIRQLLRISGWFGVVSYTEGMRLGLPGPHSLHICGGESDGLARLRGGQIIGRWELKSRRLDRDQGRVKGLISEIWTDQSCGLSYSMKLGLQDEYLAKP